MDAHHTPHSPPDRRIAVLAMAYGTPRTRDEILPYYTDIRRGRPPTDEQLEQLVARYEAIAPGGSDLLSPLVERTEAQQRALQAALDDIARDRYEVRLGMKHASPHIEEAVADLVRDGFATIACLVLAPHYSSASVGQYLARVRAAAPAEVDVVAVESWATEPAFVEFLATDLRRRLDLMPDSTLVVFTAHSLPQRVADSGDPYPDELRATAEAVAARAALDPSQWTIAWQSAGRTPEPWLGPDILELLTAVADEGVHAGVLVCACGFVADHLEVLYDLDIEAAGNARTLGLDFARTTCVNDDGSVMRALARRVASIA